MKIKLSRKSGKFLKNLGTDKFAKQIAIKIQQLANNGHLNDSKKLKGNFNDYYRSDVGEFRIIYQIIANELVIDLIGKRNDSAVYKLMKRKK